MLEDFLSARRSSVPIPEDDLNYRRGCERNDRNTRSNPGRDYLSFHVDSFPGNATYA